MADLVQTLAKGAARNIPFESQFGSLLNFWVLQGVMFRRDDSFSCLLKGSEWKKFRNSFQKVKKPRMMDS